MSASLLDSPSGLSSNSTPSSARRAIFGRASFFEPLIAQAPS
jgi:hypothetical protein